MSRKGSDTWTEKDHEIAAEVYEDGRPPTDSGTPPINEDSNEPSEDTGYFDCTRPKGGRVPPEFTLDQLENGRG